MTQLQIGLITLGALIILAVLLFNWWQERSIKREMFRRFDGPINDVLMEELRTKPAVEHLDEFHIDTDAVLEIQESTVLAEKHPTDSQEQSVEVVVEAAPGELVGDAVVSEEPESENLPLPSEDEEMLAQEFAPEPVRLSDPTPEVALYALPTSADPQIDEIAIITPNQPCVGAAIRDALQPLPAFQKPVRWLGEDTSGKALLLTKEQEHVQFARIIAALQLADRSGPANGEDLRNFHAKVEDLAVRIGGTLEWREHGDPLQYARELDQFCIDVDVMISLQLVAGIGGPFAGTKLRGVAEAGGGVLKEDGQFHFADQSGETQFILCSLDHKPMTAETLRTAMLRGVMLLMDMPRVANGTEVFNQMVLVGRKLETALSSKLMDENQRPLGDPEIDKIRQQLKILYSEMFARGVIPGSPSALRLFS